MMRLTTIRTALLLLLAAALVPGFAQPRPQVNVNYGAKTGFSSTIYEIQNLSVMEQPITEYMAHSEISSFYTIFARLNIYRHYIQTECSYNVSKYSISFDSDQWNPHALSNEQSTIGTKIIGLEVPLYYGYHLMKEGPYGMSFYIGPKAKFVLTDYSTHTFEHLPYAAISETIYPINFSLMVGIGINISRVFFDFSFEYGLHNISREFFTTDLESNVETNDFVFDRRKNVLSFSVGFIF